jgi:hypothetical protein
MTTYVLSLTGDEERAADATRWARFRQAKRLSISRGRGDAAQGAADPLEAPRRTPARDAAALAALLVRTLDLQDGSGAVVADFDSEEFAADVVARIAALGREVTCPGRVARFAFGAGIRRRFSLS